MLHYLCGQEPVPPPQEIQQCRFTHWLEKQGCVLYAGQAAFAAMETAHQQLHVLSAGLCLLKADQQDAVVLARLVELDEACEVFLQHVKALLEVSSD